MNLPPWRSSRRKARQRHLPERHRKTALELLEQRRVLAGPTVGHLDPGSGYFADSGQRLEDAPLSMDVALGDLDGDGHLDAMVANHHKPDRIWLGDGQGSFSDSGQRLGGDHWDSDAAALGDLDGDGDLDAFVAQSDWTGPWHSPPDTVWLNDGGQFTVTQQLGQFISHAVALGDLDGDGDLDAFTGHDTTPDFGPNRVWINDGGGSFHDSGQNLGRPWSNTCNAVALGDFDGDGDLDAFAANAWTGYDKVWLNDGQARFVDSGQELVGGDSYDAAVGDLDGDGDLDVCVAGELNRVWLGDGQGGFSDGGGRLGGFIAGGVSLADFDGDGDLDVFLAVGGVLRESSPNQVWINDGQAHFASNLQALGNSQSSAVALGDLDSDGDVDALVANILAPHTVWTNQRGETDLQVSKTDAAVTATPGGTMEYTISVSNLGPADVAGAVVVDTFPAQLDDVTWTATATPGAVFTENGSGNIHDLVDLPAGGTITYQAAGTLQSRATGTITNVAVVTAPHDVFDWPLVNNTAADTDTLVAAVAGGSGVFVPGGQVPGSPLLDGKDVALGDLDGDGDLDAFFANDRDPDKVWLGDGQGNLIGSGQSLGRGESHAVALGDVDGDGDLDAVVVGDDSMVRINDGLGRFSDGFDDSLQELNDAVSIALGDLDGDGRLDAVIGVDEGYTSVWLGDGQGHFSRDAQLPGRRANGEGIALGDLNGDGRLDAFITNREPDEGYAPDQVWLGDGSGRLVDSGQSLGRYHGYDVALGDVDGDGDLDAIVAHRGNTLWINDGQGYFTASGLNFGMSWSAAVALADFDGDGDLDVLTAENVGPDGGPNKLWLGNGSGDFTDNGQLLGNSHTLAIAAGDLNADGNADLVAINSASPDTVWLGDGQGNLVDTGQRMGTKRTVGVALGDVDGDGDLDAFLANGRMVPNRLLLGDGQGNFADSGQALGSVLTEDAALADVDGDGDLDAFTAGHNVLWLNDGQGVYADGGRHLGFGRSIGLGDLDGDGDPDAIVGGGWSDPSTVWINDGSGRFADTGQGLGSDVSHVLLRDLDGDGDLDALLASDYRSNTVWLNQGRGHFSDSGQLLGRSWSNRSVALADFDADGDLDLLADERLWLNDATATFADTGQVLGHWTSVAAGDFDGDGNLDAFVTNVEDDLHDDVSANRLWLGDGRGNLTDSGRSFDNAYAVALDVGDLDGDGDLDAFVANLDQPDKVWLNSDGQADLAIAKTDGQVTAAPGGPLTYTIAVTNHGPDDAIGATVTDVFPARLTAVTWTAAASPGSTCTADGSGDVHDTVDLLVGGTITYTANGTLDPAATGTPTNRATVTAPQHYFDPVPENNAAADTDTLVLPATAGTAVFRNSGQALGHAWSGDVALGDVDADGDLDAMVANRRMVGDESHQLWLNDGQGRFVNSGQDLGHIDGFAKVTLGDVDGDGDLDALLLDTGGCRIWLGDGQGRFARTAQIIGYAQALGDVDGDGDLDAVGRGLWLNDGAGRFTDTGQTPGSGLDVELADLDADGDLDVFGSGVWLNDGKGNFVPTAQHIDLVWDLDLGDVDNDGDLDALLARTGSGEPNQLLLNDGQAHFTDAGQAFGYSTSVALGDLDADGDLDAYLGTTSFPRWGITDYVWLGDGQGHFTDSGQMLRFSEAQAVALGDLNHDGDLDVFIADSRMGPAGNLVWFNQGLPEVVGRHVFYNNSLFDGHDPAANELDDAAVPPDPDHTSDPRWGKTALLPCQTATFQNYTSYSGGINGVMVDIVALPGVPAAGDFQFAVGNDNDPENWSPGPAPPSITVRPGAGVDGSDRITLVWPDNAIRGQWLQVTVLATAATGLARPDVFYFGNACGETGNSTVDAKVNSLDMLAARDNQRSFLDPAPIDFPYDFDREARVNAVDMLIARESQTHFLNDLELITVPCANGSDGASPAAAASAHDAVLPRIDTHSDELDWLREHEPQQANRKGESSHGAGPAAEPMLRTL